MTSEVRRAVGMPQEKKIRMHQRLRVTLVTAAAAALTGGLLVAGAGTAAAAPSGLQGDFNGDGYRDIAVSAPRAAAGGKGGAGYIAVVYGTRNGLDKSKHALISQATTGITGVPEEGDAFGAQLTTGDLDGDGYTDLVVGVPEERIGSTRSTGVLTVIWGSPTGLRASTDIAAPMPGDQRNALGLGVAAGDFDGDGRTDLAAVNNAYSDLFVFRGPISRTGESAGRTELSVTHSTGITPRRLVAGQVDGDRAADLLVMGMRETDGDYVNAGVLYSGRATGLKEVGTVAGGRAGVIADVDKDGYGDIVTGEPMEKRAQEPDGGHGGALTVTYGGADGLSTRPRVRIDQDTPGVPGAAERFDEFGWSLSAGDTDGDGYADVAVGAQSETLGTSTFGAGMVTVLRGSAAGLTGTGSRSFTQDTAGVPGVAEDHDHFGGAVQLVDSNNDGRAELVAGAYGENGNAGSAWLVKAGASGITATGSTSFGSLSVGGPGGFGYFGEVLTD
ncbi:FG-GAP and VCBS repeat-containing protein [Streptomyces sp. NPDC058231]|uniref:FG-GAP and VCBS repeat-containing protein n=1 Tax=Streptomyces sp. NPDC058231 TaxID=3346392 RepID=UPI0036EECA18